MSYEYVGQELELFAKAANWKAYHACMLHPYIHGDVLEVGAGVGGTTPFLRTETARSWTCLEPDPTLAAALEARTARKPDTLRTVVGTIDIFSATPQFDTIIYIDVLEHLPDDSAEVHRAAARLRPNGHLIALSPAHQWLFSPFDAAVGHERRYSQAGFASLAGGLLHIRLSRYLDSFGMVLSLANRVLLRQRTPTQGQIRFWDRWVVPASRAMDSLLGWRAGKSVVCVWQKPAS